MQRGPVAEIDLEAISNNLRVIKGLSGDRQVIPVVKADAYGHGAVEISRRLVKDGVWCLAVAFTGEAKILRDAGITAPLLVLFDPDVSDIFTHNLIPAIADMKTALALSKEAGRVRKQLRVHVKVDTGMGRLGFRGDVVKEVLEVASLKGLVVEGVMSHFSEADLSDASFAQLQIDRFRALKDALSKRGMDGVLFHLANSAAVARIPQSHFHAVRPGLMVYGYAPSQGAEPGNRSIKGEGRDTALLPAMTVRTGFLSLRRLPAGTPVSYGRTFVTKRQSVIGVLPIGYADGFSRHFSNNAEVLVRGRRLPVVGRVCMDVTMVDVTGIHDIDEGDEVIIMGRQGKEAISAWELAGRVDTIPYEILTSFGKVTKRIYRDDETC